jgi:hypothetical protein
VVVFLSPPLARRPLFRNRDALPSFLAATLLGVVVGIGGLGKSDGRSKRRRTTPGPACGLGHRCSSMPKAPSNNSGRRRLPSSHDLVCLHVLSRGESPPLDMLLFLLKHSAPRYGSCIHVHPDRADWATRGTALNWPVTGTARPGIKWARASPARQSYRAWADVVARVPAQARPGYWLGTAPARDNITLAACRPNLNPPLTRSGTQPPLSQSPSVSLLLLATGD